MLRVRFLGFLAAALLCAVSAALAADSKSSPASSPSPATTKVAADELVRSALQAETQADLDRRNELLAKALAADPDNAAAHWQLGQVSYQGAWLSIDDAAQLAGRDKLLADYREMRARLGNGVEAQRVLARRCQKNQLTDIARAHASRLYELLPDDPEAMKILGLSWYQGMLLTPEQIASQKRHDEKAKEALRYWQPRVLDIRRQIDSKDEGQSLAGWQALRAIQDPSAIGALEVVFSKHRHDESLEVVKVVGRMNGPAATDSLVRHALLSKWEDVRLGACEQLRTRPAVGYVPKLIAALTSPVQAHVEVVRDKDQVRVREIVERQDTTSKKQQIVETRVPLYVPNPNLASVVNAAALDAFFHVAETNQALSRNKRANQHREEMNDEIYSVLEKTTGHALSHDPDAWYLWWRQNNYMAINAKPTFSGTYTQYVDVPYAPYVPPSIPIVTSSVVMTHHSCFALGTKVWLLTGPVAIEDVQLGDQVLSQDPLSGELTYKPVMQTTVGNSAMLSIDVGSEQIVATPGHVFWVSGSGWRMAADLKQGDRLHTINGWAEIVGLKDAAAADTRNLVVADYGTYFVGDNRLLVHDVTMLQPYAGKVPGDTPDEVLAAK